MSGNHKRKDRNRWVERRAHSALCLLHLLGDLGIKSADGVESKWNPDFIEVYTTRHTRDMAERLHRLWSSEQRLPRS